MRTICVVLLIFLTACVSKYKTDSFTPPSQPLSKSDSAYVMLARDGAYGARTYPGSGHTVSRLLHNAILAHMSNAELATRVESLSVAISVARKGRDELRVRTRDPQLGGSGNRMVWTSRPHHDSNRHMGRGDRQATLVVA